MSDLLFRLDSWGLVWMMNFSRVQRLHTPEVGLKDWALPSIFYLRLKGIFSFLSSQTIMYTIYFLDPIYIVKLMLDKVHHCITSYKDN